MKEKFALTAEKDILDMFDKWCEDTQTPKGTAAQLGLWIVANLSHYQRGIMVQAMNARTWPNVEVFEQDSSQINPAEILKEIKNGILRLEASRGDIGSDLEVALSNTKKKKKTGA